MFRPVNLVLLALLTALPLSLGAANLSWDGDCGTDRWHCTCSAPGVNACNGGGTSNWDNDGIPGPTDTATIPPSAGVVNVNSPTEVISVNAQSGLIVDFFHLELGGGSSTIQGLDLSFQGRLSVKNGTLSLSGPSTVGNELNGPGIVTSTGPVNLSFAKLRRGVTFINQGEGRITSGRLNLDSESSFENQDSLEIGSERSVEGPLGLFTNSGSLSYLGPGTNSVFDPEYVQTAGELEIRAGKLQLRSTRIEFSGGSLSIANSAVLSIASPFGGQQLKSFSGLAQVTGLGLLDVLEDMTIVAPVALALGTGSPTTGSGGFRLNSATLTLVADLVNEPNSRMRFRFGTLVGMGGSFTNNGEAYTRGTGDATFRADVTNNKNFSLLGPGISLGNGATFTNNGQFLIEAGSISPVTGSSGSFRNFHIFRLTPPLPNVLSRVLVPFANRGRVRVDSAILRFEAPVENLNAGTLSGGVWVAARGTLDFPEAITELFNCEIFILGEQGRIPDLSSLREISGGGVLSITDVSLSLDGPLTVGESSTFAIEEGTLSVQGETVLKDGASVLFRGPAVLESTGPLKLGDPNDSIFAELTAIVTIAARASGAGATVPSGPTVITPLLNNAFGRVLPTDRGSIGTLQLNGDYAQGAGGRLAVEVVDGGSDLLSIDGNASLAGTLELTRLGDVPAGSMFTILTTTGTVTGTFDQVLSPDLFSVTYLPQAVRVTLDESVVLCGDVNGSGFVDAADPILLRQRLAGIGALQNPERCNVVEAADPADADGDGLRDDCNIADSVVLRRSLTGLGPSLRNDCGP